MDWIWITHGLYMIMHRWDMCMDCKNIVYGLNMEYAWIRDGL